MCVGNMRKDESRVCSSYLYKHVTGVPRFCLRVPPRYDRSETSFGVSRPLLIKEPTNTQRAQVLRRPATLCHSLKEKSTRDCSPSEHIGIQFTRRRGTREDRDRYSLRSATTPWKVVKRCLLRQIIKEPLQTSGLNPPSSPYQLNDDYSPSFPITLGQPRYRSKPPPNPLPSSYDLCPFSPPHMNSSCTPLPRTVTLRYHAVPRLAWCSLQSLDPGSGEPRRLIDVGILSLNHGVKEKKKDKKISALERDNGSQRTRTE